MENLWEMIAKARGLELNEEFMLVYMGSRYKHKIATYGLNIFVGGEWCGSCSVDEFIRGEGSIEKIPFRPQIGDEYYFTTMGSVDVSAKWVGSTTDYARLIAGVVFRTREGAKAYIPTWLDRISKL